MPKNAQNFTLDNIHQYGIDVSNREIYLHSNINDVEESGVDYRMSVSLNKNIRYLENISADPIIIHMQCSIGGGLDSSMGIYDSIKNTLSKIIIVVYSGAVSGTSLILQAADKRIMMPNAYVMVHEGYVGVEDQTRAVESTVERMKKERTIMCDIYAEKCINGRYFKNKGMNFNQVKKYITSTLQKKQDWYLTAEEAVHYGFADGVFGSKDIPSFAKLKE